MRFGRHLPLRVAARLALATLLAAGLAAGLPLGARAAPPAQPPEPVVILISWDGVHPSYFDRWELPAIARMRREGAEAERLVPVFPTNTFPNHVSLATGAPPDRHGIVGNTFRDAERGRYEHDRGADWIRAEPIWATAERQGVHAAVFFWVGSEQDWNGVGASYRKTPFSSSVQEDVKVDQILAWFDYRGPTRPRLILSWWHGADSVGHRHGPNDAYIEGALERQDRELGRLFAGLDHRGAWSTTTLLLVSDHGMAEVRHAIDLKAELRSRGANARVYRGGGMAHVYLYDPDDLARVRAALNTIDGVRAFPGNGLPQRFRAWFPGRTGDLVALTEPPYSFQPPKSALPDFVTDGTRFGSHGYDPERPDMSAIFLALGRGVPPHTKLGSPRAIDVAPTVARLLGIDPPRHAEGKVIAGVGEPEAAER